MVTTDTSESPPPAALARERSTGPRRDRAAATRRLLLRTAERLYAEHGISEVSNRQVAEAAGQANNSAVAYHIGTKTDLILAISRSHTEAMQQRTEQMLEHARTSTDPRDHAACLVRPYTEHLAGLGSPSWCARFTAQATTDPALRDHVVWAATASPPMQEALAALWAHAPHVPPEVAALRAQMLRVLIVHTCAEQEHEAADADTTPDWTAVGDALVDAITTLLLAPISSRPLAPPG